MFYYILKFKMFSHKSPLLVFCEQMLIVGIGVWYIKWSILMHWMQSQETKYIPCTVLKNWKMHQKIAFGKNVFFSFFVFEEMVREQNFVVAVATYAPETFVFIPILKPLTILKILP